MNKSIKVFWILLLILVSVLIYIVCLVVGNSAETATHASESTEKASDTQVITPHTYSKDEIKKIIDIMWIETDIPNSVGGVDLRIHWKNNSEKTIKYITFECVPYNAVDDAVFSEIGYRSKFRGIITGPINPGEGTDGGNRTTYGGSRWENAWYNSTIRYAKLVGIKIDYMDGSEVNLSESDCLMISK